VLANREQINGGLEEIQARRVELGRGSDPLEPIDLRTAAYVLAVKRVADVTLRRGIWP
jgi:glutamate dehydrogenase/leucine dehydrogenase